MLLKKWRHQGNEWSAGWTRSAYFPSNCGVKRVEGVEMKTVSSNMLNRDHIKKNRWYWEDAQVSNHKVGGYREVYVHGCGTWSGHSHKKFGETRLSNFLLWQTAYCPYTPLMLFGLTWGYGTWCGQCSVFREATLICRRRNICETFLLTPVNKTNTNQPHVSCICW